jgi:hypothetical protein
VPASAGPRRSRRRSTAPSAADAPPGVAELDAGLLDAAEHVGRVILVGVEERL